MFAIKSCVQKVRACTRRTAGVLGKLFAEFHCRSLRGVTFSTWRKSPKTRTGRGCFDSPSPCEPSPATTEVGLRSPFWNPLRLVQCLTLPTDFSAKINLVQKTTLVSRSFAILGGNQRGTAHGSSLAVQGWGFKRGGENAIPAPFVILCILSVHTESMPAERPAVRHCEKPCLKRRNTRPRRVSRISPTKIIKPAAAQNRSRLVVFTSPVLYPAFSPS